MPQQCLLVISQAAMHTLTGSSLSVYALYHGACNTRLPAHYVSRSPPSICATGQVIPCSPAHPLPGHARCLQAPVVPAAVEQCSLTNHTSAMPLPSPTAPPKQPTPTPGPLTVRVAGAPATLLPHAACTSRRWLLPAWLHRLPLCYCLCGVCRLLLLLTRELLLFVLLLLWMLLPPLRLPPVLAPAAGPTICSCPCCCCFCGCCSCCRRLLEPALM